MLLALKKIKNKKNQEKIKKNIAMQVELHAF